MTPNPSPRAAWPAWAVDGLATLVIGSVILFPTSGFRSAVVWIGFLSVLIRALRTGRRLTMGGLAIPVFLYGAACTVSALYSVNTDYSTRQLVKLLEYVINFVFLANLLDTPSRLSRGLRSFVLAMGLIAAADVVRLVLGAATGSLTLEEGRWFDSLLGYPTIAAGMYSIGLVLALPCWLKSAGAGRTRFIWLLIMVFILILQYWLQTRSILLGMSGGLLLFVLLAPRAHGRTWMILSAGAAAVLLALIPGTFQERLFSRSTSDRIAIWQDAQSVIETRSLDQPYRQWIGFGYGHRIFEKLHKKMGKSNRRASRVYDHTHNLLIETRIQTGMIGLLTLSGLLLCLVWRGIKSGPGRDDRERRLTFAGLAAALLLLLIYAQFSLFFAYLPALMFWSLLALYVASLARNDAPPTST